MQWRDKSCQGFQCPDNECLRYDPDLCERKEACDDAESIIGTMEVWDRSRDLLMYGPLTSFEM